LIINSIAKLYNIPEPILHTRKNNRLSRSDYRPKFQKLTKSEKNIIIQYIFDRDSRNFSPRLVDIKDIANYFLETRRAKHIWKC
jgi:hypothetical protein